MLDATSLRLLEKYIKKCEEYNVKLFHKKLKVDFYDKKDDHKKVLTQQLDLIEKNSNLVFFILLPTLENEYIYFDIFVGIKNTDSISNYTRTTFSNFKEIIKNINKKIVFFEKHFLLKNEDKRACITTTVYSYYTNDEISFSFSKLTDYLQIKYKLNVNYGSFNLQKNKFTNILFKDVLLGFFISLFFIISYFLFIKIYCMQHPFSEKLIFPTKKLLCNNSLIFHTEVYVNDFYYHIINLIENKKNIDLKIGVYNEFTNFSKNRFSKENHPQLYMSLKDCKTNFGAFNCLTHNNIFKYFQTTKLSNTDIIGSPQIQYKLDFFNVDLLNKINFEHFDDEIITPYTQSIKEVAVESNINNLKKIALTLNKEYNSVISFPSKKNYL